MPITLRSKPLRIVLVTIEVIAFVLAVLRIGKAYFADVVSRKLDTEGLELAARLDPASSDYHLKLGRLFQYSLTDINPSRALAELGEAVRLSPLDAQAWLDLGAAQELQGNLDEAESTLRRADQLAPHLPGFQWAIANFFLLRGNVEEAFRHFKLVLAGTSRYDSMIFSTAWKAVGDGDKILATLIPDNIDSQFDYLYYLLGQRKFPEAVKVWDRIAANPAPFDLERTRGYLDVLLAARMPDDAYRAWSDLQQRGLVPAAGDESNLLSNGDFEGELRNVGFGWRIVPAPGVYVGLDSTTFHSGGRSLLISFSGKGNLNYQNVYHIVKVTPGLVYEVRAFMKTDGITTDSGPRLELVDSYDPKALNDYSEPLTGTNATWTLLSLDFKPGPNTHFVSVCIARVPSQKLDNLIAGKVWVDDVTLKAAPRR